MASIPPEFHDLFEKETFAHLATLLPDGSPHVTPVWIDYDADDDRLLVNTERERQKEVNVRNDPRVAISITDPDDPYRMLSVTGEAAELTTEEARKHMDEMAQRYLGDEYPNPIQTGRVIIAIRSEQFGTRTTTSVNRIADVVIDGLG